MQNNGAYGVKPPSRGSVSATCTEGVSSVLSINAYALEGKFEQDEKFVEVGIRVLLA